MSRPPYLRLSFRWLAAGLALVAAGYACYVAVTWLRYGNAERAAKSSANDPSLDPFMPVYDVVERHQVRVDAPADVTFSASCNINLQDSGIISAIFKIRKLLFGPPTGSQKPLPSGLVNQAKSWGWGVLAEVPGREIVFGAVTKPWDANPVFRALPPDEFATFHEPGYTKIVWTLGVDPIDATHSLARTETRVAATDPLSRAKFRRYWSTLSPGIIAIRWVSLRQTRSDAERSARTPISPS
jgi:hypothetical protein